MKALDLMVLLTAGPPHQLVTNIDIYPPHIVKEQYVV